MTWKKRQHRKIEWDSVHRQLCGPLGQLLWCLSRALEGQSSEKNWAISAFFETRFKFRAHVSRTDCGREYKDVHLICESVGVSKRVSETRNQSTNGKAERMHRTVLHMACSMVLQATSHFHFKVTLTSTRRIFCPQSSKLKLMSLIEVLMKQASHLRDMTGRSSSAAMRPKQYASLF